MDAKKTPGVYIDELNAFPSAVEEAATAIPAFVGHTQFADNGGTSLSFKPWLISSMAEYCQYFGFGPNPRFSIAEKADPSLPTDFRVIGKGGKLTEYVLQQLAGRDGGRYMLYNAMRHFFMNGGGVCYIVSVGNYESDLATEHFSRGIDELLKEQEPTMLVIPEAVLLPQTQCITLQQGMLRHCGQQMKNRVAILDIWNGDKPRNDPGGDPIDLFRNSLGADSLDYGAAYYPWLNTVVVSDDELSYENVASADMLQVLLRNDLGLPKMAPESASPEERGNIQAIADLTKDWSKVEPALTSDDVRAYKAQLNKTLRTISPLFKTVMGLVKSKLNLMPPSAAMAGIYTVADSTQGVWCAPANVSPVGVVSPSVLLSDQNQEDLNVTAQGTSINAIRFFNGIGVLVWGARTLDGNSADWRYISVRRTMIMIEQSCQRALKGLEFKPNTVATWVLVRSMFDDLLTKLWMRGALVGARPNAAFTVSCGLGDTMTANDILEGCLRVVMKIALVHPNEFIEVTFQQQMQTS
ncbi:phage tail sheath family protein [Dyella sp. 20L07]|uniref:phage tail sheath family protein n=1 Tax=Dyella sp. 20L07 TaxID=3384240 RepID=UPI003D2C16C2